MEIDPAELAWLLAGTVAFLVIFFQLRRKKRLRKSLLANYAKQKRAASASATSNKHRHEPAIGSLDFDELLAEPLPAEPAPRVSVAEQYQLIILHVMAYSDTVFMGYQLLQALMSVGLRYGEMHIFHRYEISGGQMQPHPLFSVASAVEPGTFDLDAIGGFSCKGLSFFLNVNKLDRPFAAFEIMLETAYQLADELGGVVCDDARCELTEVTIKRYRQRLLIPRSSYAKQI